jgi:hypothetical protein
MYIIAKFNKNYWSLINEIANIKYKDKELTLQMS